MRSELDLSPKFNVLSPSVTGVIVSATAPTMFVAWQPSTWPPTPHIAGTDGIRLKMDVG
ncbi:MAG: hypothetical protein ACLP00_20240 [Terracidiphilus sp.]